MNREKYFIDLSKLSEEQQKHIFSLLQTDKITAQIYYMVRKSDWGVLKAFSHLFFNEYSAWQLCSNRSTETYGKNELTYPEFIKLFEGGEGEKTDLSIGWIDAQEQRPLCISTGDWDGKQSDIVLAETFTGNKFLAQCYEGIMDGSAFYDWYQVDEINSNDWLINESVSRWMKIPF